MTDQRADQRAETGPSLLTGLIRLAIGLSQGLALYALHEAQETHVWPASDLYFFAPALLVALFIPPLILSGLRGMRPVSLVVWTLVATAVVIGLAWHDVWRLPADASELAASPQLFVFTAVGLFTAHHLVVAADTERKFIASYATIFDTATKHSVQLALSIAFVGAFWLILFLGADLFKLIGIDSIETVIEKEWFFIPASTLVFAAAVHLTDVRHGLIRGLRSVALMLLSWLSPVMSGLAVAFLMTLPFTGLQPLWDTGNATSLLLVAAAALVILVNATYQDGSAETKPGVILRLVTRITALAIVPLVAIAAYATWLRVDQHGLTPDRVMAVASVVVAACYAIGSAIAALWPGQWMKPIGTTNIVTAVVGLGVFMTLFTPLADPAKISVADQVARLESGQLSPDVFDFRFLRFEALRYGHEALERLKANAAGPNAAAIKEKADAALAMDQWNPPNKPTKLSERLTGYPAGVVIPSSFLEQKWDGDPNALSCMTDGQSACEAYLADMDGDGTQEILLSPGGGYISVFRVSNGVWTWAGFLGPAQCISIFDALRAGNFKSVPSTGNDLDVGGTRLRMQGVCKD